MVIPGKLFEDMGLRYLGPIDGHNIEEMIDVFNFVRSSTRPTLVHVMTKKGKGYKFAEDDATKYHGIGKFSKKTGYVTKKKGQSISFSAAFGKAVTELGHQREDIVTITAAMPDGTGLTEFQKAFPDRFFDVGIAEGHAMTFAAGLAANGRKPVLAIYSTFLQRTYDQLLHDIALDRRNVIVCIDRAGLVGEDGPTHHGAFDISFLRTIPGAVIMAPKDVNELRDMLFTAVEYSDGPVFIRYPRGSGPNVEYKSTFAKIPIPRPETLVSGNKCAIISIGNFCERALEVCEKLHEHKLKPTVINARFAKPLDEKFYRELFTNHSHIVTLEPNCLEGGFGSGVLELAHRLTKTKMPKMACLGYPGKFVTHGPIEKLNKALHLDTASIVKQILSFI
jgi:1-deoxy-D-xylulose-5-phosphate synthase